MYIKTGISGFDKLFQNEGIIKENIYLLKGTPGSGKTTFGLEFIYNGAMFFNENGIIISFEEIPEQLYRDAKNQGLDLKKLEDEGKLKIIFSSPETVLKSEFIGEEGYLGNVVREMDIKRIVIDSVTHLKRISNTENEYRENLYRIISGIKSKKVTGMITEEFYNKLGVAEYVADGVIYLRNRKTENLKNIRTLEVFKSRGQDHISGEHYFEISRGIKVYPLIKDNLKIEGKEEERISTGVEKIDKMLDGGYIKGTFNLVVGSAGVGKTIFATNFLKDGLENKESVVFLSFEESENKFFQFTGSLGIDMKNPNFIFYHKYFDEAVVAKIIYEIENMLKNYNIKRVVIDTLNTMFFNENLEKEKIFINQLKYVFEKYGVTTMALLEEKKIMGEMELTDEGYSFLSDSIIMMRYLELEAVIKRVLTIVKARGIKHEKKIFEYNILQNKGINIIRKMNGVSGIMSGAATGKIKESINEIFQPLEFLDSFSEYIGTEASEKERKDISQQMKDVIKTLKNNLLNYLELNEDEING
ncbi:ATPase domain-containing protein [Haliovirga abyssi]|uniref:non-specific serine/threonine protein kinase n=1 Tax=Haliovirga abyssi TaxID=2996794 RepID=A0AAU9DK83_9FUSO|nr:ATPase domain-containing protein [Haliovirga abyssi]BDU50292.1 circadian clock protein KaiC [Haliovirga abyssi]